MLAGGQRSFQARHGGGLRAHAFRHLRLAEASLLACLEQGIQQVGFLALDALNFGAHTGTSHQFFYDYIMRLHV